MVAKLGTRKGEMWFPSLLAKVNRVFLVLALRPPAQVDGLPAMATFTKTVNTG